MMREKTLGVLTFSPGVSEDGYISGSLRDFVEWLGEKSEFDLKYSEDLVEDVETAREEAKKLDREVDCFLFYMPDWTFPNLIVNAAKAGKDPFLLYSPTDPSHAGLVAMIAAAGSLDQMGMENVRIWGPLGEEETLEKITKHIKVASTINNLKSVTLGLFGGRTMGMYTASADPSQIQSIFGVDIKHFDQLEIIKKSKEIPEDRIKNGMEWFEKNSNGINFDRKALTPGVFKKQISSYLAAKEIIEEENLDSLAIKCHPELSEGYCTQCLTAALMNDPQDWEGEKKMIPTACEADVDGALTMIILQHLSGTPVLFFDIRNITPSENLLTFTNCGAQSLWFAGKHKDISKNLKNVTLHPQIFEAGGASYKYQCRPGEITLARLVRQNRKYVMQIATGKLIEKPEEEMKKSVYEWPQGFVKFENDPSKIIESIGSNHMHAVYGNFKEELTEISKLIGIKTETLT